MTQLLVLRVPADAGVDPIGRMVAATGVPADELSLPAPKPGRLAR